MSWSRLDPGKTITADFTAIHPEMASIDPTANAAAVESVAML
jgi:hypothetical protein